MRKLRRLTEATRAVSPIGQVSFRGIPDREDWLVCTVSVGSVILFESAAGPLDFVLDEALRKMATLSQRVKVALRQEDLNGADDEEDDPDSE